MSEYYTAIAVKKLSTGKNAFLKYHNIKADAARVGRFEAFIEKNHPEVVHINYYFKNTGGFHYQKQLKKADFRGVTK